MSREWDGTAAVLSTVVPGLGLVYRGKLARGLLVLVGFPCFVVVTMIVGGVVGYALGSPRIGDADAGLTVAGLVVLVGWAAQVRVAGRTGSATRRRAGRRCAAAGRRGA